MEEAPVDDAGDDLTRIYRLLQVDGEDAIQLLRRVSRFLHRLGLQRLVLMPVDRLEDISADLDGMDVVLGQVVRHAGDGGVYLRTAQLFGCDLLTRGSLYQWRPPDEYSSLVPYDDGLVA